MEQTYAGSAQEHRREHLSKTLALEILHVSANMRVGNSDDAAYDLAFDGIPQLF